MDAKGGAAMPGRDVQIAERLLPEKPKRRETMPLSTGLLRKN